MIGLGGVMGVMGVVVKLSKSWAKYRMRENRNNQYRPEQIEFHRKLRHERPDNEVLMEYEVFYIDEQGRNRKGIADIADTTKKEYYRLNGGSHIGHEVKDWEQKEYLTKLGWNVIDIEIP